MAAPSLGYIDSGQLNWQNDHNANIDVLQGPIPLKYYSSLASLPAASSYDKCFVLASDIDLGIMMFYSDGVNWRTVGGQMPHGRIYVDAGSSPQNLTGSTDTKIDQFASDGVSSGLTPSHSNDKVTIPSGLKGEFRISFNISCVGQTGIDYEVSVRVGGTREPSLVADLTADSLDGEQQLAVDGIVSIDASGGAKDVELYVIGGAGGNWTVEHGSLNVEAIHLEK